MFLTHLRPARPEDCTDMLAAHSAAVQYACRSHYNDEIRRAWLALLSERGYLDAMAHKTVWVVEFKGKTQGFFQLDSEMGELDALYIHPFVQRMGLGTALLQRAEEIAARCGLGVLKLYASLNSVPFYALNGYERLGACELMLNPQVSVEGRLMRKNLCA